MGVQGAGASPVEPTWAADLEDGGAAEATGASEAAPPETTRGGSVSPGASGTAMEARLRDLMEAEDGADAVTVPFPEGETGRGLRLALLEGGLDTHFRARTFVERLGFGADIATDPGATGVEVMVFEALDRLKRMHPSEASMMGALRDALKEPFPAGPPLEGAPFPEHPDLSGLPQDPAAFPSEGQFFRALRKALIAPGLADSPRAVMDLARRLGFHTKVKGTDTEIMAGSLVEYIKAYAPKEMVIPFILEKLQ